MDGASTMTSGRGLENGTRIRIPDGCQDAGRCGTVVGNETFVGQWWCPVLLDGDEDPDFNKSSCLELLGGMEPEDWRELLHTLTRAMQAITPDNPIGLRQDRLMAIVGKIGSGRTGELDTDEMDEIRRSLMRDAGNCVDGGVRLRLIAGKIGPGGDGVVVRRVIDREEMLARLYVDEDKGRVRTAIAKLCDEELDRSGALLGRVRDLAAKMQTKT